MSHENTRICKKCKSRHSLTYFPKDKRLNQGHRYICYDCYYIYNKKYREKNKEKIAKYRKNNVFNRRHYLEKHYGITIDQYNELLKNQNNRCAICFKKPEDNGRSLAVDHRRDNGKIRGLLCNDCNKNLIADRLDPTIFLRAYSYMSYDTGFVVPIEFKNGRINKRVIDKLNDNDIIDS